MSGSTWTASPAWGVAGWTMLHYVWAGAALAVLAATGRRALRRSHPDVRYVYALASFTVLALAPAVIAWRLFDVAAATQPGRPVASRPSPISASDVPVAAWPVEMSVIVPSPPPRPAWNGPRQFARWTKAVAAILPAVWLVGAPLTFAYLATGLAGAERLRRRSRPSGDGDLTVLCDRLAAELGCMGRVAIGVCERVNAPLLLGIVRPLILLPPAALSGWTPEQIEMALLHELAHVRRWDNLVNLLQRVTESALFFHPAIWVVSGWVRREREHCCDRIVVEHTGHALGYAAALFALSETAGIAPVHGVSMAANHLVERIRDILSPEDHTMKLSRATVGLAAVLLTLPVLLLGTYAQQVAPTDRSPRQRLRDAVKDVNAGERSPATRPLTTLAKAQKKGPEPPPVDVPNRTLRRSGRIGPARQPADPNAPPWKPGPIPATITVRVTGLARDEAGKAVPGATLTLYSITDNGSKPLGKATSDAEGRYTIVDATLPVMSSFNGQKFRDEITPYARFIVCGLAPGLGIAWSPQTSMYALEKPNPDDIQGRLPLSPSIVLDLPFPKAATMTGKVIDEDGEPVAGAKLQVLDADLLDDHGLETNNRQGYDWKSLPDSVGRAVTDRQGRFRMHGLADRACYWIRVIRPETDNTSLAFYAATIDGPDTVHEQLPAGAFNGRQRHEVKTGDLTMTFPKIRPLAVTVVADDTGKSVAGAHVATLGDSLATGIGSDGTTDSEGKILLGLPPGEYKGIVSDPTIETRYIRTYQRPLVVEAGKGAQPYEIRQKAGCEVLFEAVEAGTGLPIANAFFWMASEDQPGETQHIKASTFIGVEPWTDAKGMMRAVFSPEPGKRYRFRFAGIHEPNKPEGINPALANKHGYQSEPVESELVELTAGKSVRLRFVLQKPVRPDDRQGGSKN